MRRLWFSVILILACFALTLRATAVTTPESGCYAIVVGQDVSVTGSVLMAHNEDDYGPQIVNHRWVPRTSHGADEVIRVNGGLTIPQVSETWGYVWSEIPGMLFSDSYINEKGVGVCSDACSSREDRSDLTGGGIDYMLRRIVAERASSSREGVHLAGELVERFGYTGSGRTYVICDPNEGWLFCVVMGRHWVAERVPDSQVAIIANTYTVQTVDLADTVNFLGSADLIDYAMARGWYNPKTSGSFSFAKVYAEPGVAADSSNIVRQWNGYRMILAEPPDITKPLPFSGRPSRKIGVRDILPVLRSHFEQTPMYAEDSATSCPHANRISPTCNQMTQTSFVAELRSETADGIGSAYWVCLSAPCLSCYVPFYVGSSDFPAAYTGESVTPTEEYFHARLAQPFAVDDSSAFWTFSNMRYLVEQEYGRKADVLRTVLELVEAESLGEQGEVESEAQRLMITDPDGARRILSEYSGTIYQAAISALAQFQPKK